MEPCGRPSCPQGWASASSSHAVLCQVPDPGHPVGFWCLAGGGSRERKRRQRLRANVFALVLPLSLGPGWAVWAVVPKASGPIPGPQRRLLGSLIQVRPSLLRGM